MTAHDHHHGGAHAGHGHDVRSKRRSALILALVANGFLLVAQIVIGLLLNSLALLADSLHNASDVAALGIALVGQVISARAATPRHSYGLARAEVLAALVNGAVLLAITAWVIVAAIGRLGQPSEIDAVPLALIGVLGLVVNGVSAWGIARTGGSNLNMRGAFWHLVADALGSFAVVLVAIGIGLFAWGWADPVASIIISVLVLVGVLRLLRDTVTVLLETTPSGLDPAAVEDALSAIEDVESVHHLHIWAIDPEQIALTAHLVMVEGIDLHEAQIAVGIAKTELSTNFGIDHATLEPECHGCVDPEHGDPLRPAVILDHGTG